MNQSDDNVLPICLFCFVPYDQNLFFCISAGPKWKKEFSEKTAATYGEKLRLECLAESIPDSNYTWYINNTKLTAV